MAEKFEVEGGEVEQTSSEEIPWQMVTTKVATNPSAVTVVVYDATANDEDVTDTVMPDGTHTISGDTISFKIMKSLTKGHLYRIEALFTTGDTKPEGIMYVRCTR